jgi:hypothetical protein
MQTEVLTGKLHLQKLGAAAESYMAKDVDSRNCIYETAWSNGQYSRWMSDSYIRPKELGETLPVHSRPDGVGP